MGGAGKCCTYPVSPCRQDLGVCVKETPVQHGSTCRCVQGLSPSGYAASFSALGSGLPAPGPVDHNSEEGEQTLSGSHLGFKSSFGTLAVSLG